MIALSFGNNQVYRKNTIEDAWCQIWMGLVKTTHDTCRCVSCLVCLPTLICLFMCTGLFLTQSEPAVTHTPSPTCVCLALTSAVLLSWAVAACHPNGAPTWGALKCQGAPHMEKVLLHDQTGAWWEVGGHVRMKAVAVQLFALTAQNRHRSRKSQYLLISASETVNWDVCPSLFMPLQSFENIFRTQSELPWISQSSYLRITCGRRKSWNVTEVVCGLAGEVCGILSTPRSHESSKNW